MPTTNLKSQDGLALQATDHIDSSLVANTLAGDKNAFNELVKRYLKLVYAYAYRSSGSREQAEDIAQEVFIRAYRYLPTYNQQRSFKNWLITITANTTKTHLKRQQKQNTLPVDPHDLEASLAETADNVDPASDDSGDNTQLNDACQEALNTLPEDMRQALILRHVHEWSYQDIADELGANLNSVRTWLRRGRDRLLKALN